MRKRLIRIIVAFSCFLVVFTLDKIFHLGTIWPAPYGWLLPFGLYLSIYILIGYDVLWRAGRNICHGQIFDENFLMVVATLGAFALAIYKGFTGQVIEGFDEACAVLIFYQIGEWFQKYATGKSRQSIAALMDIRPDYAHRKTATGMERVAPEAITVGEIIVINPGERVALDGIVVKGSTDLDTKSLTGEALPRSVTVQDTIMSGCINLTAQIEVKVTKAFHDATVNKILDLVENAALKKAKTENFITKFARYYTPVVVSAALLLALIPGLVTQAWSLWLYRALSFLVVSCPCALVISVPMTFFVALGVASRQGILVKGANYLEQLNRADLFVFDKTGTLTKGNFAITEIKPATARQEILRLAAIAEKHSSHPIAQAIIAAYGADVPTANQLTNVAGAGVIAQVGADMIYCGNEKLLRDQQVDFTPVATTGTVVYVAKNRQCLGVIVIQDEIKDEARSVIADLHRHQCQTVMLTGDQAAVAQQVATQVGVNAYQASLLPPDKVAAVEDMLAKRTGQRALCFVGDGINDAPVLMRADVGVAMGGVGSDAALEAADVVLMQDDLRGLLTAKSIARRTMRIAKQNIWLSLLIKLGILGLAAVGIVNMWLAVFGDVGVAFLAILNAWRVNHGQTKKRVN